MTALFLLLGLAFLVSVDLRIIAPVLPSISASLGATPGAVGLAMTTYAFAYGTGQLVYGPLSDRFVGLHTTLQVRGTELSPTARGKAFSLFALYLFSGIAVGTAVLGRVVDAGHDRLMLAVSGLGLMLMGGATAGLGRRRAR